MKEGLKDWITDIFGVLMWIGASYKMFFTEEGLKVLSYAAFVLLGALLIGLSIKQISTWGKKMAIKIINKKLA